MNNTGVRCLADIEKLFKVSFSVPPWEHSRFQERLLRFGREFRDSNLECPYDAVTQKHIQQSFRDNIFRLLKNCDPASERDVSLVNYYASLKYK